jgi:hypothetical protein
MTHWMASLSQSKEAVMIIFGALMVITVVGLELFRKWLGHAPRQENGGRANAIAAIVAIVFLAKLTLGGAGIATEGKNFLDLTFVLLGFAGIVIVSTLMYRYHNGLSLADDVDEERRKMMAHDL